MHLGDIKIAWWCSFIVHHRFTIIPCDIAHYLPCCTVHAVGHVGRCCIGLSFNSGKRVEKFIHLTDKYDHCISTGEFNSKHCYFGNDKSDSFSDAPFNPLSPHDALNHHFTCLKTDLIFLQPSVLGRKFPWNWFTNTWQFLNHVKSSSSTTSWELRQQFAACSGWDDNCKFRLERVNIIEEIELTVGLPVLNPSGTNPRYIWDLGLIYSGFGTDYIG